MEDYDSPPTAIEEQIEILQNRGMIINNSEESRNFLNRVNYYRFVSYAIPFEIFKERERTQKYKKGTKFSQVVSLYSFDSALRRLLFSAIEEIEIAFRNQLCLKIALATEDSHWFTDSRLFNPSFKHSNFLSKCKKQTEHSHEPFVQSYRDRYRSPELLPCWMLLEVLSLGTWSLIFAGLKSQDHKKKMAQYFDVTPRILQSWMRSLTVIRNFCAHHARLWNRSLTIPPLLTNRMKKFYSGNNRRTKRIVVILDILLELLKPLGIHNPFIRELNTLFEDFPSIPLSSMGLEEIVFPLKKGLRE